jgi:hypothetical protein
LQNQQSWGSPRYGGAGKIQSWPAPSLDVIANREARKRMKHFWIVLASLCVLGLLGGSVCGQTAEIKSFGAKLYSIKEISHFSMDDQRFAALTDAQKRSLIESRDDLIALLRAIQNNGDVRTYASPEMVQKYKNSIALAASIIEPETSILAAGVSDFALVDRQTIQLSFFALLSSEGSIIVSEKAAVLKETDSGWRVAELK